MPAKATEKVPKTEIRASVVPASLNENERTFEVVFGTDKPLRRRSWRGVYFEQLSFEPEHMRLERLQSGRVNFLDNHNHYGGVGRSVLGVAISYRIADGKGYATIKFSKRTELEGIWQDIKSGIICNISVGYNVYTYEKTEHEDKPDFYKAIDWEPMELSAVSIPADSDGHIRSAANTGDGQIVNIISPKKVISMSKFATEIRSEVKAVGLPDAFAEQLIKDGKNIDEARAAIIQEMAKNADPIEVRNVTPATPTPTPATPTPTPTTEARSADVGAAVNVAITNERNRVSDIRKAVATAGLEAAFATSLIDGGSSVDDARKAILEEWEKNGGPSTRSTHSANVTGEDETDKTRKAVSDAILHRSGNLIDTDGKPMDLPDNARQYRYLTMFELGKQLLVDAGIDVRGMSRTEIATMAVTGQRSSGTGHSTSDFPIILGNTINRSLRAAYQTAERTFMPFCRQVNHSDFREKTRVQISGLMGGLNEIKEGGEYKADSLTEAKEAWKVTKYGKKIIFTWESLINDDLNAFDRLPQAFAQEAAYKQTQIVYAILLNNAAMSDGTALFHANHGNLLTASAIDATNLGKARAAMRKQTGLNKKQKLNLMANYLICGPDKETEAQQVLNGVILADQVANTNLFKGAYKLIVDAEITGNKWFMASAPGRVDTVEYGFLDGNELYTETKQGFDVDGVENKVRMVFGAKAIDWRGLQYNAGA